MPAKVSRKRLFTERVGGVVEELDARGLLCPLPVLKARRRLSSLRPGDVLRMRADDPAAPLDVAHFCREQGHELVAERRDGDVSEFDIRKAGSG